MAAKTYPKTKLVISMFSLVLFVSTTAHSKIIYVDSDVTGVKDGSSWSNAYKYLQDGLADAYSGDEIYVAQGIYKPDQGTRITRRDRDATFQLINGVTIKGGYAGYGEPNPNACDVDLYETILSGDLNGDDGPNFADNADNSYHVVSGTGTDETAVLDAFTITCGNANGPWQKCGGGAHNYYGNPTLTNCTFNRNWADGSGGGMYNYDGRPTLINCTFSDNSAGNKGGGVYSHDTYEMTLINCRFSGNSAGEDGGGMACWYNYNNSPTLTNCIFSGNSAGNKGGGMSFVESEPVLSNCSFSGNSAGNKGGGIYMNFWYGYPVLTNCILWGNSDFAGMAESAQINTDSYGPPVINYICVQGWTGVLGGIGNIGADPCFVEPGYWDANGVWIDGDYHLLPDSPCIDTGDPNYIAEPNETDLDGNPRVIGGRIDMGAYEFLSQMILYVDTDATGANDGSSWADAFNYLQDVLTDANSSSLPVEIRIAQGIYKPDQGTGITPGDREATFQLKNGVTLKGGYAGFNQPDPNARDIELYETILSGDLNGDDVAVNDPCDLPAEPTKAENSYHVVTGTGTDETAILDGFTITGGNANGPHDPYRFERGGGMFCNAYSSPTVINCTFRGNMAGVGGGLHIYWDNNMMLTNCAFIGNYAGSGGGMEAFRSRATLTNCAFSGNTARNGGGMHNQDGGPTLTNCTFSANSAAGSGGGIDNFMSSPTLTNCTLTGNSAEYGGAINSFLECTTVVTNSILWANTAAQGSEIYLKDDPHYSSDASISYCNVEGGITGVYVGEGWRLNWGQGNIDSDPLFRDPDGNDNIPGTEDDNLRLSAASPCIDAGDPNYVPEPNEMDLDGNPRVVEGRIDMGAYEFQPPHILYVDDDAPNDPGPGDPSVSDPEENGTEQHPFDTIQEAMDVAGDGDTVIVLPGDYYENTDFMGKNFTLTSADPEDPTIRQATRIHAESGYAIIASDGNIFGLSISGNNGIRCFDIDYTSYSPTIRNCRIIVERIGIRFTLPYCHEAVHPVIENNIIAGNHHCIYMDAQAFASGGVEGVIRNNVFTSSGGDKIGCGITYRGCKSVPEVVNNIFVNLQYGIHIFYCCKFQERTARINYNNLYDNHHNYRVEAGSCPLDLTGVQGNISEDPLFVDFANGDFHLGPNSPCINAGDPNYVAEPNETDLDGKPRIVGGRIDMGAYEYSPPILAEARIVPRTINLTSMGKWITAFLWLPKEYNVADIDPNSVLLEDEIKPEQFSVDEQEQVAIARFTREEVQAILSIGEVELTITGQLTDGSKFEGTDTIKVIDKTGKK